MVKVRHRTDLQDLGFVTVQRWTYLLCWLPRETAVPDLLDLRGRLREAAQQQVKRARNISAEGDEGREEGAGRGEILAEGGEGSDEGKVGAGARENSGRRW